MKNEISGINSTTETAAEAEAARAADFDLAQRAAAGDVDAFEQIYWRHHRRVFGLCLRMIKNVHEAEDVTQQIFLNLFQKIGSFRGDSAFSTWLHRITVNQMLMHIRTNKIRKEDVTEDGELPEVSFIPLAKLGNPNQIVSRLHLNEAIAKLAEGYRKVLILHDIEGYEHDEIAEMLGCASGTSKSQLFKARRVLRGLLTGGNASRSRMRKAVQ